MTQDPVDWVRAQRPGAVITPLRSRPWATVWRVEADGDRWWLKVNGAGTGYEPRLLAVLRRTGGDLLPQCVVHPDQPWALVSDAGRSARELLAGAEPAERLDYWCAVLPRYAELQRAADPSRLAAAGVPDLSPDRLVDVFDELLADRAWFESPAAPELTGDQWAALVATRERLAHAAEQLAAGLPATVQHEDLHDANVFGPVGAIRVIDWGDAVLGHPFGTLRVTLDVLADQLQRPSDDPGLLRVQEAYLEPWRTAGESRAELERQVDLAVRTGALVRATGWRRALGTVQVGLDTGFADAVSRWMVRLSGALI